MAGQPTTVLADRLDREALLDLARERAGLSDFGDTWFFEPMDHYIAASNAEGRPSGVSRPPTPRAG